MSSAPFFIKGQEGERMVTPKKIIIFDTSELLNIAKYAIGKAKLSANDKPTFVIYGFLVKLHTIMKRLRGGTMVFAIDGKSSLRKEQFPEYKIKRKTKERTPEEIEIDNLAYPQFDQVINDVLPTLGVNNIFGREGYEGDDVIGSICKSYPDSEIIIVSGDKDMYQLINDNVYIYPPRICKPFNIYDFEEMYGITPKQWRDVKVYGGCTSDGIPGIPLIQSEASIKKGIPPSCCAEAGALSFLKGDLKKHTLKYKSFFTPEAKKVIRRNKFLVTLPMYGVGEFTIQNNQMSRAGLERIIDEFKFESLRYELEDYCKVLRCK